MSATEKELRQDVASAYESCRQAAVFTVLLHALDEAPYPMTVFGGALTVGACGLAVYKDIKLSAHEYRQLSNKKS
jgi:hypothetical protein